MWTWLFEYVTSEDFLQDFVTTGVIGILGFVLVWARRRAASYWLISRNRRIRQNYIEIWRRLKNDEYLVYQEKQSVYLWIVLILMAILVVVTHMIPPIWSPYTMFAEPRYRAIAFGIESLLLCLLIVMIGVFNNINQAARAYRARLRRRKGKNYFVWPPFNENTAKRRTQRS